MKTFFRSSFVSVMVGILLLGCAGYDRVLFVTKTNFGLDIDTTPPTFEVTVARRELAIQPTYLDTSEKEKTLPMLASFGTKGPGFNPQITSIFAGGRAAVALASDPKKVKTAENGDDGEDRICLTKEPDTRSWWKRLWEKEDTDEKEDPNKNKKRKKTTRAFYFATDTSFGAKVGWTGATGPYPETLKLGYNRKEFAYPPIFVKEGCKEKDEDNEVPCPCPWEVKSPSFLAMLDNSSVFTQPMESGVSHVQFFATGKAATKFAERDEVNEDAFAKMAPGAANIPERENATKALNKELVKDIRRIYDADAFDKKDEVVNKAKELMLVNPDIGSANFLDQLDEKAKEADPVVSNKLNELRVFIGSIGS